MISIGKFIGFDITGHRRRVHESARCREGNSSRGDRDERHNPARAGAASD
jgi:hypothetical protein